MNQRLAADIGGTFTDLVMLDGEGNLHVHKSPSTPGDFRLGVLTGVEEITSTVNGGGSDQPLAGFDYFVHGATVVLNALLQRRLPATALITTRGFRDVLEIMRTNNPFMYDMQYVKPAPLVARRLRFEIDERIRHTGEVLTPLDEASVRSVAARLRETGVAAVAVCLLHAYANGQHERRVRDILAAECPDLVVCLSSDVAPEVREFERTSTTTINATTIPIITSYLDRLSSELAERGLARNLCVMQSNGGVISANVARNLPVRTVMSGPSGGVVGASYLADMLGVDNLLTLDMGGTSTDIGVVADGRPLTVDESHVDRWPILAPMVEILAIGAGGGSIGWIDAGGGLRVGPQSAGAVPGPVCYRRGGDQATVSDACLVLGRLDADYFLGGGMPLDVEGAHRVVRQRVAEVLGMNEQEAAAGMIAVVTANMAKAMRQILVARGLDPRDFTLMAFGGAGGMVVGDLLRISDVAHAVVPNNPGALCAIGMLVTDFRHDAVATLVRPLDRIQPEEVAAHFDALAAHASAQLRAEGNVAGATEIERYVDVRYIGQEYYLRIPVADGRIDFSAVRDAFNVEHERTYGYANAEFACELVNLRVTAFSRVGRPALPDCPARSAAEGELLPSGTRSVYFDSQFIDTDIYMVESLRLGDRIEGPAIVEDPRSTVVILPGQYAHIDRLRSIHIHRGAA